MEYQGEDMTPEELLNVWTRHAGAWSLWTRPILFAQMSNESAAGSTISETETGSRVKSALDSAFIKLLTTEPYASGHTILFIDLPGEESTWMGLAVSELGYCPVPVFNACTGPAEVIPQGPMIAALQAGGHLLASRAATDGPPAFLLDSRRMTPARTPIVPGDFDNRWQIFPQDLPSSAFLTERGFNRVLLIQRDSRQPQEDVTHVLRRWQEAGLSIEVKDLADLSPPSRVEMTRPAWYRAPWQRVLAAFRLRRNPKGGFGEVVPEPSKSHG